MGIKIILEGRRSPGKRFFLYLNYRVFCIRQNIEPMSLKEFYKKMEKDGFTELKEFKDI